MRQSALAAQGLAVHFGASQILHDVSLDIAVGRWTSIVGPNGAGKSTLLKAVAGLIPHGGEVRLLGQPLGSFAGRQRAQKLSWLGQGQGGADDLSVYDVAMLGRLPYRPWLSAPSAADHAAVERALRATQAWPWRERALGHLSGGERQRVLLARALAVEAEVMLMDEPLANLDPPHQADWLLLVRDLVRAGRTVVSVLHEVGLALQADDMLILDQGRLRHMGPCADAATQRALEAVFDHRISVRAFEDQWVVLPGGHPGNAGVPARRGMEDR